MRNREQVRAANANDAIKAGVKGRGVEDGDAISGFPALIVNNGLLAALAFSISKKGKGGYGEICDAVTRHLAHREIALVPDGVRTAVDLRDYLCKQDSEDLRLCTAEALTFLNYLRRFAKGEAKQRATED